MAPDDYRKFAAVFFARQTGCRKRLAVFGQSKDRRVTGIGPTVRWCWAKTSARCARRWLREVSVQISRNSLQPTDKAARDLTVTNAAGRE